MKISYDKGEGYIFQFDTSDEAGKILSGCLWLAPDGFLKFNHLAYGAAVIRSNGTASAKAFATNDRCSSALGMLFPDGSSTFLIECLGEIVGVYNFTGTEQPVINGRTFRFNWTRNDHTPAEQAAHISRFNEGLGKAADLATELWEATNLDADDVNLLDGFRQLSDCPCGTDHIKEIGDTINGKPAEAAQAPELSDDDIAYLRDVLGIGDTKTN